VKKLYIFIGLYLLFFATSCTTKTYQTDNIHQKNILAGKGKNKGGNPEVKIINDCFKLKNEARNSCLNIFYPDKLNIIVYPPSGEIIRLAGRKSSIERREFDLKGEDKFIFYLDISRVNLPIRSNVISSKYFFDKRDLVIDVDVKKIRKDIILYDGDNRVLLEYKIVK